MIHFHSSGILRCPFLTFSSCLLLSSSLFFNPLFSRNGIADCECEFSIWTIQSSIRRKSSIAITLRWKNWFSPSLLRPSSPLLIYYFSLSFSSLSFTLSLSLSLSFFSLSLLHTHTHTHTHTRTHSHMIDLWCPRACTSHQDGLWVWELQVVGETSRLCVRLQYRRERWRVTG